MAEDKQTQKKSALISWIEIERIRVDSIYKSSMKTEQTTVLDHTNISDLSTEAFCSFWIP